MNVARRMYRQMKRLRHRWHLWRYGERMRERLRPHAPDYAAYLETQLQRTIRKNDNRLQPRTVYLVDKLAELVDLREKEVLCIGCRNHAELKYIAGKGAKKVTGIDLFSSHPDILVMDMHQMTFPDNSFDIVYSSHSLEHALDPKVVVEEFQRVCRSPGFMVIEVPVLFDPTKTGADLVDFKSNKKILKLFPMNDTKVLFAEDVKSSGKGSDVARVILQIKID